MERGSWSGAMRGVDGGAIQRAWMEAGEVRYGGVDWRGRKLDRQKLGAVRGVGGRGGDLEAEGCDAGRMEARGVRYVGAWPGWMEAKKRIGSLEGCDTGGDGTQQGWLGRRTMAQSIRWRGEGGMNCFHVLPSWRG